VANSDAPISFAELRRNYTQRKDERDRIAVEMQEIKSTLDLEFSKHMIIEAAKLDIDVHQLFGRKGKRKSNGKAKPLYRDPANPNNTWSGRGKPSKWLAEYIKQGRKKEEFKIASEPNIAAEGPQKPSKAPKGSTPAAKH
jgi:DNA-binding protein H-NS